MRPWGALLTGFAVSTAYWPGILSSVFVPRWAAIALLVPLLWRFDLRDVSRPILWAVAILLTGSVLSLVQTPDAMTGLYELFLVLILAVAFVGGAGLARLDDVMAGLALGCAVSSVVVVAQLNGWRGVPGAGGFPPGLFYNSEMLAEFAALVLIWGLVRRQPLIVLASIVPVIFCGSRIAVLAVAVAMLYAWWPRRHWVGLLALTGLAVAAVAMIVYLGDFKIQTAGHRVTLWLATVMSFEILGNGLGWVQIAFPVERFSHSDVLQMFAEIGVFALPVVCFPYLIFRNTEADLAARAVFMGICFEALVSFPLHFPATGFVAAVAAGHLLGRGRMVFLGQHHGGNQDGVGVQRSDAADGAPYGAGGRGGGSIPVRSIFAWGTRLRALQYQASGG